MSNLACFKALKNFIQVFRAWVSNWTSKLLCLHFFTSKVLIKSDVKQLEDNFIWCFMHVYCIQSKGHIPTSWLCKCIFMSNFVHQYLFSFIFWQIFKSMVNQINFEKFSFLAHISAYLHIIGTVVTQLQSVKSLGKNYLVFPKLILQNQSHDNPHHNDIISRYIYLPFQRMQWPECADHFFFNWSLHWIIDGLIRYLFVST